MKRILITTLALSTLAFGASAMTAPVEGYGDRYFAEGGSATFQQGELLGKIRITSPREKAEGASDNVYTFGELRIQAPNRELGGKI